MTPFRPYGAPSPADGGRKNSCLPPSAGEGGPQGRKGVFSSSSPCSSSPSPALAIEPSEMLKDPALEARAREIGRALRCVVCQNQAIDDSNAEVAHDMRRAVRDRLTAGDSDDAVMAFMVARYGDYVLLKPPFKSGTLVLWLGAPLVLLIAGGALLLAARKRRPPEPPAPLTEEERAKVDSLLGPRHSSDAINVEASKDARSESRAPSA